MSHNGSTIKPTWSYSFHRYVQDANEEKILILLSRGLDVDIKDMNGRTALMLAITIYENVSIIKILLIDYNADIYNNSYCNSGSVLNRIIKKSHSWLGSFTPQAKHMKILELFFARVASDFFVDRESTARKLQDANCPLALIQFTKSIEIIQYFLERKCDFPPCVSSLSALHLAVVRKDLEIVKILIAYGVDLNAKDIQNQTALFAYNNHSGSSHAYESLEMLSILLNNGASLHVPRLDGTTPMRYLLEYGHEITRSIVYESVAFRNCKLTKNEPLLHYLLRNESLTGSRRKVEVNFLLSHQRVNVDVHDDKGHTALTYFLAEEKYEVWDKLDLLVRHGARVCWLDILTKTRILNYLACISLSEVYEIDDSNVCAHGSDYYRLVLAWIIQQQLNVTINRLFVELTKGFERKLDSIFYMKIVIAHLVIYEATGEITISHVTREQIELNEDMNELYVICKNGIDLMKMIRVGDYTVTLYQLLTESDENIHKYIGNQDFVNKVQALIYRQCYQHSYYIFIVRKRIENALRTKELRRKCGERICKLTGLLMYGVSGDHLVVSIIMKHLNERDIWNLFEEKPDQRDACISCLMQNHTNDSEDESQLCLLISFIIFIAICFFLPMYLLQYYQRNI